MPIADCAVHKLMMNIAKKIKNRYFIKNRLLPMGFIG